MKKNHITLTLALGLLCLLVPATRAASVCNSIAGNLVTNCGFESGSFSGWTVGGNLYGGVGGNYVYVDNGNSNSGTYDAALGAPSTYGQTGSGNQYGPDTTLDQSLPGLQKGYYYEISFYLDNNGCSVTDGCPGYYNHFDFTFDGQKIYSVNNLPYSGAYSQYVFVAETFQSTPLTGITFSFSNDDDLFYFDDISVTSLGPTPEPASFLLVAPALAGLVLFARRKASRSRSS